MTKIIDFLAHMAGTWHLDRAISEGVSFQGLAHIRTTDVRNVYGYHEEGSFIHNATSQDAYRDYLYKVKGQTLDILFADPHRTDQLYVSLDFAGTKIAHDTHVCGDDIYAVVFEIINGDHFLTETMVSGPEKDYRMISHYKRL